MTNSLRFHAKWAIVLTLYFSSCAFAAGTFSVKDSGAAGDGKTKDTAAFQKAIDSATAAGGGTIDVPAGDYLIGSIILASNSTLKLEAGADLIGSPDVADYPMISVRYEGEFVPGHRALISAEKADHFAIYGPGKITGPPVHVAQLRNPRGPVLVELTGCTNAVLDGFSTQYQRLWSIHPMFCQNLAIKNLTIRAVMANGDGIDVDSCKDVSITHCDINSGDDAIALKSGRGIRAAALEKPDENIDIEDCSLASSSFGGVAIGSEISSGIRNVTVKNCIISGHQNGIFIKSRDGRGAFIENVHIENVLVRNSPTMIKFELAATGIVGTDPVTDPAKSWTRVSNITLSNIQVDNVATLVWAGWTNGKGVPDADPIDGFTLSSVTGTCGRAITLANMKNVALSGINVTGFQGQLIMASNVQGTGLDQGR
jgi:polygalacturonase